MNLFSNQHIRCSVRSCAYNEEGKVCSLDEITVSPNEGCKSVDCSRDCCCASYRKE